MVIEKGENKTVCTRYAPSPTGNAGMHIGNLRTALYSYLYATQNNGKFILRIEDTDRDRSNDAALNDIRDVMNIFNLHPHEIYTQSARLPIYRYYAHKLIALGFAYPCTCTDNEDFKDCKCRLKPDKDPTTNYCIRLDMSKLASLEYPTATHVAHCHDCIRNAQIRINFEDLYDIVLLKSDGYPTYHLASVVDDHLMGVTDVFRGDEWISSFPYHSLLYSTFGWNMPKFYHLPLITNQDGAKLSKRDGDFSVNALLSRGLLPAAILNYVALLGWHPSGNEEIFDMTKLVKQFDVARLTKSSACYDENKLLSYNMIWGRTEIGKIQFENMFRPKDKILIERLYTIFKNGINVSDLMNNLSINHDVHWTPKLNDILRDLNKLIYKLPYVNHAAELITDEDTIKIMESLEKKGYSKKDINESIRIVLTGSIKGLPAATLLGLIYTTSLTFKIGHYVL